MRKKYVWISSSFFLPLGLFVAYLLNAGPGLPDYAYEAVKKLPSREVRELVKGTSGYAQSGPIKIWYEVIGDTAAPPVLMINGLGGTALTWSPELIRSLVQAGYRVIRFDHRDLGATDRITDWSQDNPYTLENMADDALAILNTLDLQQVHLIGYSMGGMIAQRFAIEYPERVKTFTCISSSGYMNDPELTALSTSMKIQLLRFLVKGWLSLGPRKAVYQNLEAQTLLRNNQALTRDEVAFWMDLHTYNEIHNRVDSKAAGEHQVAAILASGSRLEELPRIQAPTLILHGTEDPLILPEHAEKYKDLIPYATFHWVEGMGHILTTPYVQEFLPSVLGHLTSIE